MNPSDYDDDIPPRIRQLQRQYLETVGLTPLSQIELIPQGMGWWISLKDGTQHEQYVD